MFIDDRCFICGKHLKHTTISLYSEPFSSVLENNYDGISHLESQINLKHYCIICWVKHHQFIRQTDELVKAEIENIREIYTKWFTNKLIEKQIEENNIIPKKIIRRK